MSLAGLAEKEAGNQAFKDGDIEKAILLYSQAIDANPREPTFYSNRSAAFHKLGKFQKAVDDAMKCVELKPEWPKGYFRLGEGYFGKGLFAKASDAYSTALDLEPTDVGVREALAKAQKALYSKALEEDKPSASKAKPSYLAKYDSDDDDMPKAVPKPAPSLSGNAAERHKEIMNRRLAQSTGISSLEEYMKYRSSAGGKPPDTKPSDTSLPPRDTPPVPPRDTPPLPLRDTAGAASRAEWMKSMGIDAGSPVNTGSNRTSPAATTTMTQAKSTSFTSSACSSNSSASSQQSELARQRAEFLASINAMGAGNDSIWSKISASDRMVNKALNPQDDEAWQTSSVSTSHSDEHTPTGSKGGQTPPLYGRRSATPPQGLAHGSEAYAMPPERSMKASASGAQGPPRNGRPKAADGQGEDEVDTTSLARVAIMGASVSANHPLFAGVRTKAIAVKESEGDKAQSLKKACEGLGNGLDISRNWIQEFRSKKDTGKEIKAVGDEKVVELKETYKGFHYRKYKENCADDDQTKKVHLSNAITAEALADYDYTKLV